jgi:2-polyprenyl-6-methoxyphenol hydroxylase-like FAD-dependent oxidoreductase
MGDAAHTTHFTIGSGTGLAIADAISLAAQLNVSVDLEHALTAYERERSAALRTARLYAGYSARWFENVPRYIHLPPEQFAELLFARGSIAMQYIPPGAFLRLRKAAQQFPLLARRGRQVWRALQR